MKKLIAVSIIALASVSCQAQDEELRAPVNILSELYKGCMVGFLKYSELPTSNMDIEKRLDTLDKMCIQWMKIWYPPMVGETEFNVPVDVLQRTDEHRRYLIQQIRIELIQAASGTFTVKKL